MSWASAKGKFVVDMCKLDRLPARRRLRVTAENIPSSNLYVFSKYSLICLSACAGGGGGEGGRGECGI